MKLAYIRKDLLAGKLSVPVGDKLYYGGEESLPYRWVNETSTYEGEFQIYYQGSWHESYSIDWDFNKSEKVRKAVDKMHR